MSLRSFNDINDVHIDVLREIANIGSGSAATSLSDMLGQPVDIFIPEVGIAGYNEAYEKLGGPESVMVGVLLTFAGDLTGMIMFLLPVEFSCNLINLLMCTDIKNYEEIDETGFSAVCEVANIMSASLVRAITGMTGLFIDISPPEATVDMLGSIMSVPTVYFAAIGDKIMYMKNEIEIAGQKTRADILMLPDMPSLEKLMGTLGIDV